MEVLNRLGSRSYDDSVVTTSPSRSHHIFYVGSHLCSESHVYDQEPYNIILKDVEGVVLAREQFLAWHQKNLDSPDTFILYAIPSHQYGSHQDLYRPLLHKLSIDGLRSLDQGESDRCVLWSHVL